MARVTSRKQLAIYEVRTEDGGVGIKIGEDGAVHMGYDTSDLMRLLLEIFPDYGNCPDPLDVPPADGDLLQAAEVWLDEGTAAERRRYLNEVSGYRER